MQITVAPYLLSTYKLIQCAFPNGIETQDYLPLLLKEKGKIPNLSPFPFPLLPTSFRSLMC